MGLISKLFGIREAPPFFDIAIVNDKDEVQYYYKWIHRIGFIKLSKEVYEND